MARVLVVGIDPDLVDYSDPALPPGMDAAAVRRGIALGLEQVRAAGHDVVPLAISPDHDGVRSLAERLADVPADCVVIGGGFRLPRYLVPFEAVLNTVARAPSRPAIALVSRPEDCGTAADRALAARVV